MFVLEHISIYVMLMGLFCSVRALYLKHIDRLSVTDLIHLLIFNANNRQF